MLKTFFSILLIGALCPQSVSGGACGNNDPALPVPECRNQNNGQEVPCSNSNAVRLWPVGLRPGNPGQVLPPERDSTQWTSTTIPGALSGHELFHGLEILGSKLYVAYNAGFQIWDVAGLNAESPSRQLTKDGWRGDFLDFPAVGENDFYIDDIDVITAGGGVNMVALSGRDTVGFSAWEHTLAPFGLSQKYQDLGNRSSRVRVVAQGGINYAFAAGQLGIFVYDLDAAQALASPCLDDNGSVCPGIYKGKLGETNLSLFIDTIRRDGRVYIAKSGGTGIPLEIWEVTTLSSPGTAVRRFQGLTAGAQGMAFFEIDAVAYLGVIERFGTSWRLKIYDVDACLDTNGCVSLGTALVNRPLGAASSSPQFLTYSVSDTTPFLYYGLNEFGIEGDGIEQLIDLSGFPGSVSEVTESGGSYTDACNGQSIDYWGDYYPDNDNGLRNIRPMIGKFRGDYFYRAAYGILDVHYRERALVLNGPSEGFTGDSQSFTVTASGCTPDPTYNWSATGGGVIVGNGATVGITWSTPGSKSVTVTNDGCPGFLATETIEIFDPEAMVGAVSLDPSSPRVCEEVVFTAEGVTGRPPIADQWTITRNTDGAVVAEGSGPGFTFRWNTMVLPTPIPGSYTAEVVVSNSEGSDTASRLFNLAAAALEFDNGPTYDGAPAPQVFGTTVQFFAGATGDSSWAWNFGDPGSGSANTSTVENPTHVFDTPGIYTVTLEIASCDPGVPPVQGSVMIEIIDDPLEITSFTANCLFGVCEFCTGDPVTFFIEYEGEPQNFSYDWDGDGTFDESASMPIGSHTYDESLANFFPRARIAADGEEDIFTHVNAVQVVNCGPPMITVDGPTSLQVDQVGEYSSSAVNCSPNATGWSWMAMPDGDIMGDTSTDQVSISWSTLGEKTVTATNSSCGGVQGTRSVTVFDPGEIFADGFESGDTSAW